MGKEKLNVPPIPVFRQLMDETGAKREEIARAIGVSTVAVGQYYNGETLPSIENLIKIADYFNVSTDYLLGRTGVKTTDTTVKGVCEYTGLSTKAIERLHLYSSREARSVVDDIPFQLDTQETKWTISKLKEDYSDIVSILYIISEIIINGDSIFNEWRELLKSYKIASIYENIFINGGFDKDLEVYKYTKGIYDNMIENTIPYQLFRSQHFLSGFIEHLKEEINTNEKIEDLFHSVDLTQYIEIATNLLEEDVNGKHTGEKK